MYASKGRFRGGAPAPPTSCTVSPARPCPNVNLRLCKTLPAWTLFENVASPVQARGDSRSTRPFPRTSAPQPDHKPLEGNRRADNMCVDRRCGGLVPAPRNRAVAALRNGVNPRPGRVAQLRRLPDVPGLVVAGLARDEFRTDRFSPFCLGRLGPGFARGGCRANPCRPIRTTRPLTRSP